MNMFTTQKSDGLVKEAQERDPLIVPFRGNNVF